MRQINPFEQDEVVVMRDGGVGNDNELQEPEKGDIKGTQRSRTDVEIITSTKLKMMFLIGS